MRKNDNIEFGTGKEKEKEKELGCFGGVRQGWNLLVIDDEVWLLGWKE